MCRKTLVIFLFFLFVSSYAAAGVTNKTYDVIIVGGGIAGLTAAWYLDDGEQYDILLLEKEDEVGGRTSSGRYRSVVYPQGPEYLGEPEEPLAEMIEELGLTLREIPAPADIIFRAGKFHYGELGKARLLVSQSSLAEFNRFVYQINRLYDLYDDIPELVLRGELQRLDTISAGQWFAENNFPQIYREIYNVSVRGLFGAGLDDISALSAIPEFAFDFEGYEPVEEEEDLREEFSWKSGSTGMFTFDGGLAELTRALAMDMAEIVRTGTEVKSVKRAGPLYEVVGVSKEGREQIYRAEAVVLATPAPVALILAEHELTVRTRELLAGIRYAPYATVALYSDSEIFGDGFDLAVEDGLIFTDMYNGRWVADHFGDGIAKQQDSWVTLAYVAARSLPEADLLPTTDTELLREVVETVEKVFPGASQKITGHDIRHFKYGFPVMEPGSYKHMMELFKIENDGIFLAGDYLIYPTFEAAALSGQLVAEKVKAFLSD